MPKKITQKIPSALTIQKNRRAFYFIDTIPNAEIKLKKHTDTTIVALITHGWEQERRFIIRATEPGAHCRLIFFILGNATNKFIATIQAIHQDEKTNIKARIRTALTDEATCSIAGDWIIEPRAKGADTHFAHHTLLLSEKASAKTSPNLEIKTDSVKAGHSASVGKIDEDVLFYLLSRGISETDARALLVQGFFESELSQIDNQRVQDAISQTVKIFLA